MACSKLEVVSIHKEPSKQIPNRIRAVIYKNKEESGFEIRTKYVPQNPDPKEDAPGWAWGILKLIYTLYSNLLDATANLNPFLELEKK